MEKIRYISCDLIENGFDFNVGAINFCCRPGVGTGGFKAIVPNYNGEKINWKKFFEIKNKYRKQMQEGNVIPECEGCVHLYENDWDTDNYLANINFNSWTVCNARCTYCDLEDFHKQTPKYKDYKVLPIVKDMIKRKILKNTGVISIAGGEPTIIKEFEVLIDTLIKADMKSIRVLSNGIKYSKMAEKALQKGILTIVISTDSGIPETYEKIKQIPAHNKVWENIKNYALAQSCPTLVKTKYIIIPGINDNKEEIDAWINKNIEAGVKSVAIDIELNWFAKNHQNIPQETYNILNYLIEESKANNLEVEPHDRATLLLKWQKDNHGLSFHGREIE